RITSSRLDGSHFESRCRRGRGLELGLRQRARSHEGTAWDGPCHDNNRHECHHDKGSAEPHTRNRKLHISEILSGFLYSPLVIKLYLRTSELRWHMSATPVPGVRLRAWRIRWKHFPHKSWTAGPMLLSGEFTLRGPSVDC